ncbi:MAG TPA: FAD binding domain-containing protein [Chloroflexota bacterium]|nr:FAD binding domain-containing protein [Chloroflexota bacterium]
MATGTGLRVAVVGGSLGGLNAALWLQAVGCAVTVFERAPAPLEDRGAGIVLHQATIRYLALPGGQPVEQISAPATWLRYLDAAGQVAHESACAYRFTAYNVLYRGLLRCLGPDHYRLGAECLGFEQDAAGVTAWFANGHAERCDLLVCADGIASFGRRRLFPACAPHYAGYVAWRGVVSERELSPATFALLHGGITYHLLPDGHLLVYPIPNRDGAVEPGRRLMNWLWYRNVAPGAELEALAERRSSERWLISIPPGAVSARAVRQLHHDAAALPSALAETITKTRAPFIQVIYDIAAPRMVVGRVVLIGDAAFTVRPHVAAGTAKAAEDAWTLAHALRARDTELTAALARWEARQRALGERVLARAREAGEQLQHGRWPVGRPLPFGLYVEGDSVLGDVAGGGGHEA